jgi:5'(3')-deoxyribonucleotidase
MKICIDMDGTIANFSDLAIRKVRSNFGIEIKNEELEVPNIGKITWDKMTGQQRSGYKSYLDLYKFICPPGFFRELNPFLGATNAVKELYNIGAKIIFLTKPLDWTYSTQEKMDWLNIYFKDIEYSVIMVNDMTSKSMIDCDILIDDDPLALMKLPPYNGICIERPWNKEFREKAYTGISVKEMYDASEFIIKNFEFMSQKDKGAFDAPKS